MVMGIVVAAVMPAHASQFLTGPPMMLNCSKLQQFEYQGIDGRTVFSLQAFL